MTAERPFLPVPLANAEIQRDDLITIVGYGRADINGGTEFLRRFGRNRCAQFLANDREKFKFEKPGALVLAGDSGGPGFREGPHGLELVGIASKAVAGENSTFTSTFFHREWLLQEIRNAAGME
jgi:transglutaminase-like putative cysteine protease